MTLEVCLQMGKVGSSSIVRSFPTLFQLHSWSGSAPIQYFSTKYRGTPLGQLRQAYMWRVKYSRVSKLYKIALAAGEPVRIVTGVREPMSRNISAFFQTMPKSGIGSYSIEDIHNEFLSFGAHYVPACWFDMEIKAHFGVDVYKYPFDKNNGYSIIKHGGVEIFIYRIENINGAILALEDFLNRPGVEFVASNKAADKKIGAVYNQFLESFVPPSGLRSDLYSSQYFHHFYDDRDIIW